MSALAASADFDVATTKTDIARACVNRGAVFTVDRSAARVHRARALAFGRARPVELAHDRRDLLDGAAQAFGEGRGVDVRANNAMRALDGVKDSIAQRFAHWRGLRLAPALRLHGRILWRDRGAYHVDVQA